MPAYESSLTAKNFAGIYQGGDGYDISLSYAMEGKNFDVRGGALYPMTAGVAQGATIAGTKISTLAAVTKRYSISGSTVTTVNEDYLVAVAGGTIYYRQAGTSNAWAQVTGVTLTESVCDFVTYEVNTRNDQQTLAPIDVLLLTNAKDGMTILYTDDFTAEHVTVWPSSENHDIKFGVISRHAERIWGSAIDGDPDKLMYSAPYDPFDWEQNNEIPEDGAGDILQPSWDGDRFTALRTYGSYLLAVKRNTIWRVLGTNPGEYVMKEQYGGGALYENTIATYGDYVMMLGDDGLMRYDGSGTIPFRQPYVEGIMKRVNQSALGVAVAAVCDAVYYLALPLDGSDVNNAVLEYDFANNTFALREGVRVDTFMPWRGDMYFSTVAEVDGTDKARVYMLGHGEGTGYALPVRWVSGWQDAGARNVIKSAFRVYLRCEQGMTLTVSVQTEKKTKSKTVTLTAGKPKRVAVNVSGRFFRIILETAAAQTAWWCLGGGLQATYELDYD